MVYLIVYVDCSEKISYIKVNLFVNGFYIANENITNLPILILQSTLYFSLSR